MRRLEFAPEACRDLIELWDYIAADNVTAADRVVQAIDDAIQLLAEMPGIGHTRSDVPDPQFRFWPVYSYLIVYRFTDSDMTVVRVIHGAATFAGSLADESVVDSRRAKGTLLHNNPATAIEETLSSAA